MAPKARSIRDRFFDMVELIPFHSCWEWIGGKNWCGYGVFHKKFNQSTQAHRVSYELLKGEIPTGLVIDHLCKNRSCVNPNHLEAVTQKENVLRSDSVIGKPVTHCSGGHLYEEKNTYRRGTGKTCKICKIERQRKSRRLNAHPVSV